MLRVGSGLAVDGLGRELYLGGAWCYDLAALVSDLAGEGASGSCDDERTVEACLSVRLDPCPASPVPALADPCDLSRRHTSDSRVVERVRLAVEPGRCPARVTRAVPPGAGPARAGRRRHRRRGGPRGRPGRGADRRAAGEERVAALLQAFRRLAALDAADLAPYTAEGEDPSLFPQAEPGAVMLAELRVRVRGYGDGLQVVDYEVDPCVRPTLLPTAVIADLVCGLAPALLASGATADAGGPRVERAIEWPRPHVLRLRVTKRLLAGSLADHPVAVTSLSERGWVREDIVRIEYDPDDLTLSVILDDEPAADLVRVVVRGTGPTPVFGAHPRMPLAGLAGGPAGGEDDGHDAVLTLRTGRASSGHAGAGDEHAPQDEEDAT